MAHAKPEHIEHLEVLLGEIRKIASLKEKSKGCFYLKGKGVLHFHVKAERLYAHVFDSEKWVEVDIEFSSSAANQKRLSKTISQMLAT